MKLVLVYIEWVDASGDSSWRDLKSELDRPDECLRCCSVGWLLKHGEQVIRIAGSFGGDGDGVAPEVSHITEIPVSAVIMFEEIRTNNHMFPMIADLKRE